MSKKAKPVGRYTGNGEKMMDEENLSWSLPEPKDCDPLPEIFPGALLYWMLKKHTTVTMEIIKNELQSVRIVNSNKNFICTERDDRYGAAVGIYHKEYFSFSSEGFVRGSRYEESPENDKKFAFPEGVINPYIS